MSRFLVSPLIGSFWYEQFNKQHGHEPLLLLSSPLNTAIDLGNFEVALQWKSRCPLGEWIKHWRVHKTIEMLGAAGKNLNAPKRWVSLFDLNPAERAVECWLRTSATAARKKRAICSNFSLKLYQFIHPFIVFRTFVVQFTIIFRFFLTLFLDTLTRRAWLEGSRLNASCLASTF